MPRAARRLHPVRWPARSGSGRSSGPWRRWAAPGPPPSRRPAGEAEDNGQRSARPTRPHADAQWDAPPPSHTHVYICVHVRAHVRVSLASRNCVADTRSRPEPPYEARSWTAAHATPPAPHHCAAPHCGATHGGTTHDAHLLNGVHHVHLRVDRLGDAERTAWRRTLQVREHRQRVAPPADRARQLVRAFGGGVAQPQPPRAVLARVGQSVELLHLAPLLIHQAREQPGWRETNARRAQKCRQHE
eukprot:scaffold6440_cov68-Phaeocystis_antarctica.AAC.5